MNSTSGPLISVLIPCYNVEEYVAAAIRSILAQTYMNLEVLVLDDGSTDETLQKIREFNDVRIKVISLQENSKKVGIVNQALGICSGDFIAFQDADDWSEPSRLLKQLDGFDDSVGICFTGYKIQNKQTFLPDTLPLTNEELRNEFINFGLGGSASYNPTICATMMIKRDVLSVFPGYHPYFAGKVGEDIFWVYQILKRFEGKTIDEPLYNVRIRPGSLTDDQWTGQNIKAAYSWEIIKNLIGLKEKENIDLLESNNKTDFLLMELKSCEEALQKKIKENRRITLAYEKSYSFKIGKAILTPIHRLKSFFEKVKK